MKVLLAVRHSLRLVLALLIALGAVTAAFLSTASVAAAGHTGQALALRDSLRGSLPNSLLAQKSADAAGRFRYPRDYYQPRRQAGRRGGQQPRAVGSTVLIDEGVQTFDVFAPPPGFQPGDGPLTPINMTPVWTSDGRRIIFSSNRSADGHFHLWSIAASGDNPLDLSATSSLHQITTGSGNEFYPAIYTPTNAQLAFVSTAGNGTQNLYSINNGFDAATTQVDVGTLTSLTIRNTGSPNDLDTHFGKVDRPTWSPGGDRLAFSAVDTDTATPNVHHLWSLFVNSGGGTSDTNGPSPNNPPAELTAGLADDTDPAWSPDAAADLIAFATTDTGGFTAGSPGSPALSAGTDAGTTGIRSIFVITSNSAQPTQVTTAGQDDFGPAWNVNPAFAGYLTFARGTAPAANHGIFFLPSVYTSGSSVVSPEAGGDAVQINTDDQPGRGAPNNPGNLFNKVYPAWSPFLTLEAVVYSSNRSITYNDPATGSPVESAVSLAPGTNGVGAGYIGLLISRYDDLDPPTFLPYNSGENIHVTDGATDTPRRNGDIRPGSPVQFTVRLSNRETGVDDDNVYIQIKDPDSKYQDSKGLEHKVFTQDVTDSINQASNGQPDSYPSTFAGYGPAQGAPQNYAQYNVGSNSIYLYNGGAGGSGIYNAYNQPIFDQLSGFPFGLPTTANQSQIDIINAFANQFAPRNDAGEAFQTFTVGGGNYLVQERGAVGGTDGGTPISVGRDSSPGSPITTGTPPAAIPLGNGDPSAFQSFGQEYECQFVDANYNLNGATDTTVGDYGTPFYLAGVDDQGAHSGGTHAPPTDANGNLEWLKLTRSPNQDGQGGVLYTATWTTPTSASDYYLDVIAYDKAVLPDTPATTAANWRIYDNIWGFSTQAFQGGKDILVVSDNTLGQKFVASTFGGNGLENIPPIFYGAESYFTDIDTNLLPNAIYRYVAAGTAPTFHTDFDFAQNQPQPDDFAVALSTMLPLPEVVDLSGTGQPGATAVLNGLGVDSYTDPEIAVQSSNISNVPVPISQQYSLWRILARGPVDPQVLNTYSPTSQPQPAVNDPLTGFTKPAATVPVNHRCVIWTAPYAGDLPLNTVGSIADGATQNELRAFVLGGTSGNVTFSGGGRLCVSGANVAATVSGAGVVPAANTQGSFISDVLNASFVPVGANGASTGGNQSLTGNTSNLQDRISGDSFFNPNIGAGIDQYFLTQVSSAGVVTYAAPNSVPMLLGNNYIEYPPTGLPALWRTDGSLDQLGPLPSTFGPNGLNIAQSQIGLVNAQNGATVDTGFNTVGPGFGDPTSGSRPAPATTGPGVVYQTNAGPNGARTVFASLGLEGIGIEYYKQTINQQDFFFARNQRPNILHNVVDFLRTATVSGTITQGSNGGQSAVNAVVYLVPNGIPPPNTTPPPFVPPVLSALTASDGSYQIQGVEPGSYFVVAYKNGFTRVETPVAKDVEGDTTVTFNLNLVPVPPGSITGKVKDSSGNGIGGASLTFTSVDGLTTVSGTSRADGTYTITGVPPTSYNSLVVASGFNRQTVPDLPTPNPFVVTSSTTTANVNFTLGAIPGTVGGLVVDVFNGTPVGGATIRVTNATTHQPVLDANGAPITFPTNPPPAVNTPPGGVTGDGMPANYTGSLPQGTYTLTLTPPAFYINPQPVSQNITVTTGAFTRVPTFTLTSTLGTLQGTVTVAGTTTPIPGATVTATQTNAPAGTTNVQTFTTAADGTYGPTPQLTQGTYTLVVTAPTYLTQTLTGVTIAAHQTVTKNFALVSTLGTFGGDVTDYLSSQPLAGASVSITNAAGTAVGGSPLLTGAVTTTSPADASGVTHPINFGPVTLPATDANGTPITYLVNVTDVAGPAGTGTTAKPAYIPSQTFTVTLTAGHFTVQNVTLVSAIGALGGLITDSFTNQLLAGSTITVADPTGAVVATLSSRNTTTSPAAPLGNGTPQNYGTGLTLYGGTGTVYTVTASATNHTVQTATVTVSGSHFTPLNFSLVSTIGAVGGLVLDASSGAPIGAATVTITNAAGAVVTTFTTTAATSTAAPPAGDNNPVNYSGPLTQGAYSATVSKRGYGTSAPRTFTVSPNTFTRIDFSGATYGLPPIHVFPAGYSFFSAPYDYASIGVGFDQLFGTLNTGTRTAPSAGSNRSHIFVWSPALVQYVLDPTAPADGLHLGQGYWVYLLASHEVTVAGPVTAATAIPVTLHQGWNQIGVPSLTPIALSNLTFDNPATGGTISFSNAASTTYRLVSSPLYGYNGSTYVTMTAGSMLQPWQSYWIYAFADITVNIPTS